MKGFRHHADDVKGTAVDADRFAKNGGIGRERLLPEMMTYNYNGSAAGSGIVGRRNGAAHEGLGTEHVEVVAGDKIGGRQNRGRVGGCRASGGGQTNAHLV